MLHALRDMPEMLKLGKSKFAIPLTVLESLRPSKGAPGVTFGPMVALGCSGLLWADLGGSGRFWAVLGSCGMLQECYGEALGWALGRLWEGSGRALGGLWEGSGMGYGRALGGLWEGPRMDLG